MKRKTRYSDSRDYPATILYIDDIQAIVDELDKDGGEITIESGDLIFETVEELREHFSRSALTQPYY